jgi:serine protease AprX
MNYPNHVITSTIISFSLEQDSWITMELLDLSGRKMKTLLDANTQAGNHHLQLNRGQLSAGIYFLQIKMNRETAIMKVVIQ